MALLVCRPALGARLALCPGEESFSAGSFGYVSVIMLLCISYQVSLSHFSLNELRKLVIRLRH